MDNTDFDPVVDLVNSPDIRVCREVLQPKMSRCAAAGFVDQENVYDTIDESRMAEVMDYKDNSALCGDLRFITNCPEMCDVVFLVGKDKVQVCGVKAILATRSRVFFSMLFSGEKTGSHVPRKSAKSKLISRIKKIITRPRRQPSSKSRLLVFRIAEFEPEPFREVISFLHTGAIHIDQTNVIGLMNVADTYGLDELRLQCCQYAGTCITLKRVIPLLLSTEIYSTFKWTKILSLEIMDFISQKAQDILRRREFYNLSQRTAEMILCRSSLRATEEAKWNAAVHWCRKHCSHEDDRYFRATLRSLTSTLNFCDIPLTKLRNVVQPLGIVPDDVINRAISHQSRPRLVIGQAQHPETVPRRLTKQRASTSLPRKTRSVNGINQFPIQPLASSTFDSSRLLNTSDSGFVVSSANCSLIAKL